jgi:hypothetical protein
MGKVFKRLPSPSMAVAFVALLAALGGTAVALPGGNSVKKDDIAAGAVNSSDLRNNSVLGRDVRTSTLRGSDIGANTVTGSDVNEGSLGTVPSANTANSAGTANTANSAAQAGNAGTVDGISLVTIDYRAPSGAATSTIFERNGLRIVANCLGGDLDVTALSLVNNAAVSNGAVTFATVTDSGTDTGPSDTPVYGEDDDFDILNAFQVLGASTDDGTQGNLVFTNPAGTVITITYRGEEDPNGLGSTNDCFFTGRATVSG